MGSLIPLAIGLCRFRLRVQSPGEQLLTELNILDLRQLCSYKREKKVQMQALVCLLHILQEVFFLLYFDTDNFV